MASTVHPVARASRHVIITIVRPVRQNLLVILLELASSTQYHPTRGRHNKPHSQPRSSVASVTASVRPVRTHAVTVRESEIGSERSCRSASRCKSATLVPTGPRWTRMIFWVIIGDNSEAVVGLKSAVTTAHPPTRHLSLTLVQGQTQMWTPGA